VQAKPADSGGLAPGKGEKERDMDSYAESEGANTRPHSGKLGRRGACTVLKRSRAEAAQVESVVEFLQGEEKKKKGKDREASDESAAVGVVLPQWAEGLEETID